MAMRNRTDLIVVHVTATPPTSDIGAKEVRVMHKQKGWADIGYHWVIRRDGKIEKGRNYDTIGAHVAGFNSISLGISLVGGVDKNGKAENNATKDQMNSLEILIADMLRFYPKAKVCGHRDLSPDGDKDGYIEKGEWIKECPCFDAIPWAEALGLPGANIKGDWTKKQPLPTIPGAPMTATRPTGPDERNVYLQKLLARAGFAFGPIDGILGPKTEKAVKAFQTGYELPITGAFDAPTVKKLRAMFE